MIPEKEENLCAKYSKILSVHDENIGNSPVSAYGIECEDGWFDLIDTLCKNIQSYVDWKIKDMPTEDAEQFQPAALQIKSKFGGLRFYYSGGDELIAGMVRMAESMSFKICEMCGNSGSRRGSGWIFTLCNSCWDTHPTNKH